MATGSVLIQLITKLFRYIDDFLTRTRIVILSLTERHLIDATTSNDFVKINVIVAVPL